LGGYEVTARPIGHDISSQAAGHLLASRQLRHVPVRLRRDHGIGYLARHSPYFAASLSKVIGFDADHPAGRYPIDRDSATVSASHCNRIPRWKRGPSTAMIVSSIIVSAVVVAVYIYGHVMVAKWIPTDVISNESYGHEGWSPPAPRWAVVAIR
jgi:hypothetical protein